MANIKIIMKQFRTLNVSVQIVQMKVWNKKFSF